MIERTLEWEGSIKGEIIRMAWPITVSLLSYNVMTLVDTLLMGRLGAAELAGVGMAGTVAFVLFCFSVGLLTSAKTLVAQTHGTGRREEIEGHLRAAVVSALAIGIVTIGVGQGLAQLLARISASAQAGEATGTYLRIRVLGAPLALLYVALREIRYGEGDSRSPMIATIVANAVNIALAVLFVVGFNWGVAGAAAATCLAHAVEACILVAVLGPARLGRLLLPGNFRMHDLRRLWRIGFPTGVQWILEFGAFAVLAAIISTMSDAQMAGHQIALQVSQFATLPALATGEAASVLVAQAVGARRYDLVIRVAHQSLQVAGVYGGGCLVLFAVAARAIASCFTSDPATSTVAVQLLHVAAVFLMIGIANIIVRSILRGCADVRFPAVVGVLTSWILTPALALLLGYRVGLGAFGMARALCRNHRCWRDSLVAARTQGLARCCRCLRHPARHLERNSFVMPRRV